MNRQIKKLRNTMLLILVRKKKHRLKRYKHQDRGFILFATILMLLILTSLLAAYNLLSKVETSSANASASSNTGFYAAEAGLNLRAKQIRDTFVGYNRPQGNSPSSWQNCVNNTSLGSGDFACDSTNTFQNQTVSTYVVEDAGNPNTITINPGDPFAGMSAQEYRYDLTSVSVNVQKLPTAILGMRFKSRLVPMFQFLGFYNKDLEITDPPTMNLNGRIHANGDIYLEAGLAGLPYTSKLTLNGQISTTKTLYSGSKYDSSCSGSVYIYDPNNPRQLSCSGGIRTTYVNNNVTAWNQQILIGINSITVPPPENFNPTPGATYWDRADLRVVLQLDATGNPTAIEVRKQQDNTNNSVATNNLLNICALASTNLIVNATTGSNVLTVAAVNTFAINDMVTVGTNNENNFITNINIFAKQITLKNPLLTTQSAGSVVRKAITSTSSTFYNKREKKTIRMLEIDAKGLLNCIQAHKKGLDDNPDPTVKGLDDNTDGGLVWFLTVAGPNSNTFNAYGVRVRNGQELASSVTGAPAIQGLTIVSDQAVYIQGNYNYPSPPSTNTKKPAAVMADTINVLSSNWNIVSDSNSLNYLSTGSRTAALTKINAAFLAGTDITGGAEGTAGQNQGVGSFNGGLNNYPRLHEDWTNVTLTYRGSFVTLGQPRRVNGPWCGIYGPPYSICDIYIPPNRDWDYDTDFNNAANLPPLTPRFVYLRQEVFSRNFTR